MAAGTSSSFLESDLNMTDEYLYVPDDDDDNDVDQLQFMSVVKMIPNYEQNCYGGKLRKHKSIVIAKFFVPDFHIPTQQQHSMNPFHQTPSKCINSGPSSLIDYGHYGATEFIADPPLIKARTTPVMGTKTYQHRRTLSNVSSQYSNRGVQPEYGDDMTEVDYRFNNFNISGIPSTSNYQPLPSQHQQQFHSVPYHCNQPDASNINQIPDRMRLYENVSHFQHRHQHHPQNSPLSPSQNKTPIKTPTSHQHHHHQNIHKSPSTTNSERRQIFFNSEHDSHKQQNGSSPNQPAVEPTAGNTSKTMGSTGCTPTHSTPHDSFSDDSASYLSALSSQNRIRFSPDNFLTDATANNTPFSPTSRMSSLNFQRSISRRPIEIDDGDKS